MEQKLRNLIKEAMIEKQKTGNSARYQTYKNILEQAQKFAKEKKAEVNDTHICDAAKKEVKQLEELLAYCAVGSPKAKEVEECITYAKGILPQMASLEDIQNFLKEECPEKNMGACMKSLKAAFGDRLDSKLASLVAKDYISEHEEERE